jgi:electron transfer flavoprotein beta subunit
MNIVVPIKFVPDLVEELTIDDSGTALDTAWLRMILNEFDDHAIEQAILLKEAGAGSVTVVAPDTEGVDDALFAAAAKGADRLIKLTGNFENGIFTSHALARVFANAVKTLRPELILTGVQAHNDLDGAIGARLAELLGMPYVGYVSGVSLAQNKAKVRKEYPGGLIAEMEITLPGVVGVQSSSQPPRYVPISKVRQAMKTAHIEEAPAAELESVGGPAVSRMFRPEVGARAEMIEGDTRGVAARLVELFREHGIL